MAISALQMGELRHAEDPDWTVVGSARFYKVEVEFTRERCNSGQN